ncbi:MAG: glycosyltransferase [Planctomycetaceae bacterium]
MSNPDVSIMVCSRNRAEALAEALKSLTALETAGFDYEIVVVDNASTDHTAEVVASTAQRSTVPVRYVREPRAGIAFARNCGVKTSRGEWIAFFDDDQWADPRWLVELLAMAKAKNVRGVGGAVLLRLPAGNNRELAPFCRTLLGETVGLNAPRRYSSTVTPGTCNLMLHRSVFEEVGLFNEMLNTRGEDTELFIRVHARGIETWYTPAAVVFHLIPPERLTDSYLEKLTRLTVIGMAKNDRYYWGRLAFPFVWTARLAQMLILLIPRWAWAHLRRNRELAFGTRCRLALAYGYLRNGLRLILGGDDRPSESVPIWRMKPRRITSISKSGERL